MTPFPAFGLQDLRQALEPNFGPLALLRIIPPADPASPSARWIATDMDGDQIEGVVTVTLVEQSDGALVLRPKVLIEGASGRLLDLLRLGDPERGVRAIEASLPKQVVEDRLREIGIRLRKVLTMIRTQPGIPAHEMAFELGEIVQLAEGAR